MTPAMWLLVLLFIAVPIAEIYVIIQVGQAIGALWTIALLIADSVIGARLVAWQGRLAWRRFVEAIATGRIPHDEVTDGVLVVVGGTLLLTPGFITDLFGFLLLVPPTRALIRRAVLRSIRRRGAVTRVVFYSRTGPPPPADPPPPGPPPPAPHQLPRG
jgi:UPF0716 protein FxsA